MNYIDALIPLALGLILILSPQSLTKKKLSEPSNEGLKKKVQLAGKVLLGVAVLFTFLGFINVTNTPSKTTQDFLKENLPLMNQSVPKQVDEVTTLTEITSFANCLIYNYEVDNKEEIDFSGDSLKQVMKEQMIKKLKNNVKFSDEMRKRKVTFRHIFKDKNSSNELVVNIDYNEY